MACFEASSFVFGQSLINGQFVSYGAGRTCLKKCCKSLMRQQLRGSVLEKPFTFFSKLTGYVLNQTFIRSAKKKKSLNVYITIWFGLSNRHQTSCLWKQNQCAVVVPIQQACQNIWTCQHLRRCIPRAVHHTRHLHLLEEETEEQEINTKTDMDSDDMIQRIYACFKLINAFHSFNGSIRFCLVLLNYVLAKMKNLYRKLRHRFWSLHWVFLLRE